MLDQLYCQELGKKLRIAPLNVVRENAEVELLQVMTENDLTIRTVFYGGTALRLAYGSPRFSEDLDFLMIKQITMRELEKTLENFARNYSGSSIKDIKDKRRTLFALINITHPNLKHPVNLKIEISKRKNGLKTELLPISSPCSHLTPIVFVATIQSMLTLKENAIRGRDESRDWFDLWFIARYLKQEFSPPKELPFSAREFKRELKRFLPQDKWSIIDQIVETIKK